MIGTVIDITVFKCLCVSTYCACGHKYKYPHYPPPFYVHQCPKCGRPDPEVVRNRPESTGPEHYGITNG